MRFLDIDLDFFLNKNAYAVGHYHGRLGPEYKPWSTYRVQHFLESRCCLALSSSIPGCTVKNHDEVLGLWRSLIKSGRLTAPFDVVHIDAHPDIWVGGGLYLEQGRLHVQPDRELDIFKTRPVHEGNFLNFAIARGWVRTLIWVTLGKYGNGLPAWDGDAHTVKARFQAKKDNMTTTGNALNSNGKLEIPYQILPWNRYRTKDKFDYMALSRSPNFTPPESDNLIDVIERYMKKI
jgi:hypothetical protein